MKSQEVIAKFILLRAKDITLNEIVKILIVSKPTLVSWCKKYALEIKKAKELMLTKLVKKIIENDEESILKEFDNFYLNAFGTSNGKTASNKKSERAKRKLNRYFKVNIKSITVHFYLGGKIKKIKVGCK